MKGIILAGGRGSRLYPLTLAVSKQLLPVHDRPMIYYPLSVLMIAGIREILLISTRRDLPQFQELLGDGSSFGLSLSYAEQPSPNGLAEAFIIGREFIQDKQVALILGDNILYGKSLGALCLQAKARSKGASIFAYQVSNPTQYGVISFDESGDKVYSIEEKPQQPSSNWAITGLYFYDNDVVEVASGLKPSHRGELEISDVNRFYLERGDLHVHRLGAEFKWLDAGTYENLHDATSYIRKAEIKLKSKIMCPEEIALQQGYVTTTQVMARAELLGETEYSAYLRHRVKEHVYG